MNDKKLVTIYILCGYKGSGKDTLVNIFKDKTRNYGDCNLKIERYAFADPLKDICYSIFSKSRFGNRIQREHFDRFEEKENVIEGLGNGDKDITPRELCLDISKFIRGIDNYYFIHLLVKKIKNSISFHKFHSEPVIMFITDCRYQEEMLLLKELKDYHINVDTKSFWIKRYSFPNSSDPSENSITETDCDYSVFNLPGTSKQEFFENFISFI